MTIIAIEYDHRNSGFSHRNMVIFYSYVTNYQRVIILQPQNLPKRYRRVWNQDDHLTMFSGMAQRSKMLGNFFGACCMRIDFKWEGDRWLFVQKMFEHIQLQWGEVLNIVHFENDITDRLLQYCDAIWKKLFVFFWNKVSKGTQCKKKSCLSHVPILMFVLCLTLELCQFAWTICQTE